MRFYFLLLSILRNSNSCIQATKIWLLNRVVPIWAVNKRVGCPLLQEEGNTACEWPFAGHPTYMQCMLLAVLKQTHHTKTTSRCNTRPFLTLKQFINGKGRVLSNTQANFTQNQFYFHPVKKIKILSVRTSQERLTGSLNHRQNILKSVPFFIISRLSNPWKPGILNWF